MGFVNFLFMTLSKSDSLSRSLIIGDGRSDEGAVFL